MAGGGGDEGRGSNFGDGVLDTDSVLDGTCSMSSVSMALRRCATRKIGRMDTKNVLNLPL